MANLRVTSNVNDLASQISGLMLHPLGLETPLSRPATQCLRTQAIRSRRNSHGARKGTHHFEAVMKISPGDPVFANPSGQILLMAGRRRRKVPGLSVGTPPCSRNLLAECDHPE